MITTLLIMDHQSYIMFLFVISGTYSTWYFRLYSICDLMLVDNHNRKYIFGWIKLPETCDRNEGVNLLSKLMSASPVTV